MNILVVNAGSSTIKLSLFGSEARNLLLDADKQTNLAHFGETIANFIVSCRDKRLISSDAGEIKLVGHRIVHGGPDFREPARIDQQTATKLSRLATLAPLHNPPALDALQHARRILPHAIHVTVFDTAFFSSLPERAFIYPVPYNWFTEHGIRRYGFHGISHEYCSLRAAEMLSSKAGRGVPAEPRSPRRLIICHLGSGCSASAILDGKPIATTMGFTPMEGLMMATRSGSIDPGILSYLLKQHRLSIDEVDQALNRSSGLLGVSGISSGYREVEAAAAEGNARAKLALDIYADRILETIGSYSALLGGLDALVFTGGVGEHQPALRATVSQRLDWMNVRLDPERNANCSPDTEVSHADSGVHILVIHTREDLMIAQASLKFLV